MIQRAKEKIELLSCANLRAGMGKFWASDSDSECEDLGDAEVLASGRRESAVAGVSSSGHSNVQEASILTVTLSSRQSRPGSQSAALHPAVPPWKKVWKGPLPPRRVSPTKTLGDIILPALATASGRRGARTGGDSLFPSVPISNSPSLSKRNTNSGSEANQTGPRLLFGSGPRKEPAIVRPTRSLVRPLLVPDTHLRKTYAAIIMAGG